MFLSDVRIKQIILSRKGLFVEGLFVTTRRLCAARVSLKNRVEGDFHGEPGSSLDAGRFRLPRTIDRISLPFET